MAHANFFFRMKLDLSGQDDDIEIEADSAFEDFSSKQMDENNGYTTISVITSDGRSIDLRSEEDRKRAEKEDADEELPAEGWWKWVNLLALQCVAIDMHVEGASEWSFNHTEGNDKIDSLGYEDLTSTINHQIPKWLAEEYEFIIGKPKIQHSVDDKERFWSRDYERHRVSAMYEIFRWASYPPFANWGPTPYDYRAFDLCYGDDANAILVVDIHT